jgi:hypothetical protein
MNIKALLLVYKLEVVVYKVYILRDWIAITYLHSQQISSQMVDEKVLVSTDIGR